MAEPNQNCPQCGRPLATDDAGNSNCPVCPASAVAGVPKFPIFKVFLVPALVFGPGLVNLIASEHRAGGDFATGLFMLLLSPVLAIAAASIMAWDSRPRVGIRLGYACLLSLGFIALSGAFVSYGCSAHF